MTKETSSNTGSIRSLETKLVDGEKVIRRADGVKARYSQIKVREGFNLRLQTADFIESVNVLAAYIVNGGNVPPLELAVTADNEMEIVDGHRRHAAIGIAIETFRAAGKEKEAAELEWVKFEPFKGTEAEKTVRIMTSAEGRPLAPLETAAGYVRLADEHGLHPNAIAQMVGKTRQHVDLLLHLGRGDALVHQFVADGKVSATEAAKLVRDYGENAGRILMEKAEAAELKGGKKVTASAIKSAELPKRQTQSFVTRMQAFTNALPMAAKMQLAAYEADRDQHKDSSVLINAYDLYELLSAFTDLVEARDKKKHADVDKAAKAGQHELEEDRDNDQA